MLLASAYLLTAYRVLDVDPVVWLSYENGIWRIAVTVAVIQLGLYFQDLYSDLRVVSRFELFQKICLVIGAAFLLQALFSYGFQSWVLPKWIMMWGSLAILAVLPIWRILYGELITTALGSEKVIFVGASDVARQLAQRYVERPELNRSVAGFIADEQDAAAVKEGPVLGPVSEFRRLVEEHKPQRLVVGMSERRQRLPMMDLLEVNFTGTQVEDAGFAFEDAFGRVCSQQLRSSQLIFSRELGPRPYTLKLQAVYSFVIFAPVMVLVAVAVRATSKGPALFRQRRTGQYGQVFTLYKFRSMRENAEAETGAVWASKDDPRITPVGRFIRKTRFDELPQLFNVLRGEMAIVGPRPERPEFLATLSEQIPFYRQRLCVRPGITGWAQINHRYGDTLEDTVTKIEYDLYYIKHLSPALDFFIMFHTVKVMLLTRGAQ
jgi:exopolysaccharide biosynthesis polyprenyl glycosylphosphotransferase